MKHCKETKESEQKQLFNCFLLLNLPHNEVSRGVERRQIIIYALNSVSCVFNKWLSPVRCRPSSAVQMATASTPPCCATRTTIVETAVTRRRNIVWLTHRPTIYVACQCSFESKHCSLLIGSTSKLIRAVCWLMDRNQLYWPSMWHMHGIWQRVLPYSETKMSEVKQ